MFKDAFEALYTKQLSEARGQRRENLEGELYGTKKMLEVLYPVLGTLDGVVLEYEMTSLSGVKIYADALLSRWRKSSWKRSISLRTPKTLQGSGSPLNEREHAPSGYSDIRTTPTGETNWRRVPMNAEET